MSPVLLVLLVLLVPLVPLEILEILEILVPLGIRVPLVPLGILLLPRALRGCMSRLVLPKHTGNTSATPFARRNLRKDWTN